MVDLSCCKFKCMGCEDRNIYYLDLYRKSVLTSGNPILYTLSVRRWSPEKENDLPKGTKTCESEAGPHPSLLSGLHCARNYLLGLRWRKLFHEWGQTQPPLDSREMQHHHRDGGGNSKALNKEQGTWKSLTERRLEPIWGSGVREWEFLWQPSCCTTLFHMIPEIIFTGSQHNAISSTSKGIDTTISFKKYCWIICRILF